MRTIHPSANVFKPRDAVHAVWEGMTVLCNSPNYSELWQTRQDYISDFSGIIFYCYYGSNCMLAADFSQTRQNYLEAQRIKSIDLRCCRLPLSSSVNLVVIAIAPPSSPSFFFLSHGRYWRTGGIHNWIVARPHLLLAARRMENVIISEGGRQR